ncbi:cyclophilin-like fold protein [Spirosoma soli]|uniref:Cyclophilin-like fold protein n=1 Tax=Spirosoma soli TaxID=1770529 RepID=A0ABW5M677_9BACT
MKRTHLLLVLIVLVAMGGMACKTDNSMPQPTQSDSTKSANRLRIRVGSHSFTATLLNNATVTAFKAKLPITLSMKELNRNEKFADLPTSLPTNAVNPRTIQAGDLMLYGANTLVLFYETFQTSYSYTKLGHIENSQGLATALGSGNVSVTFELE